MSYRVVPGLNLRRMDILKQRIYRVIILDTFHFPPTPNLMHLVFGKSNYPPIL